MVTNRVLRGLQEKIKRKEQYPVTPPLTHSVYFQGFIFHVSLKVQLGVIIHICKYYSSYSIDIWHLLFRTFVPYILATLARCQSQLTFQTSKQLSYNTTYSIVSLATVVCALHLRMVINHSQDGSPSALEKKKNRRLGDWFNWHPSFARMTDDINIRPIQLAISIFKLEG